MSCTYKIWGEDLIDPNAIKQMDEACSIEPAVYGACMADSHLGYSLPIGGVLALENAISPMAVGVDIACRMMLTAYEVDEEGFRKNRKILRDSIINGTTFGVGQERPSQAQHKVMDQNWNVTSVTKSLKDKAWKQLGTSGSGNHFVEWGILAYKGRKYLALLSHSGSRGSGATVCNEYNSIAQGKCPDSPLSWLSMDSEAGQEYWEAMNLMGDYASANHHVIHETVADLALIGDRRILTIENHHNFCWKEEHNGKTVYVHRKGATPAQVGVLGIIPGSMNSPAYLVSGKGNQDSLCSASHGAGRVLSRTQAKKIYNFKAVRNDLYKKDVDVISAGADEVPGVYKDIDEVMKRQTDLIEVLGCFTPKIVKMSESGRAED